MGTDFVSIILPVFNGEPYLSSAIKSITSQTHKNFELWIIDDGSTDNSLNTIIENSRKDNRIKYQSRENRGLGETLNELIGLCSSEYIARMDSDDICEPNRISLQYAFMKAHEEVGMVGGQIKFLVGDNVVSAQTMPLGHSAIRSALMEARFPICHPAIMFRRSIAKKIGGYKITGAGEDLDFFLRASEVAMVTNISEYVLRYRMHLNSLSVKKSSELNKAYAFSIENAKRRSSSITELSTSEFEKIWEKRSVFTRIRLHLKHISEILYRKSIIYRSAGLSLYFYTFILMAALLRPRVALKKIFGRFLPHA